MVRKKTSRQLAIECARICEDKKAADIAVLDIRKLTFMTDFFIVCSTGNERQARAIAEELAKTMKSHGLKAYNPSPHSQTGWILMDFGDVVIHSFSADLRTFYDIESLWADAPRLKWQKARKTAVRKKKE